MRLRTAPVPFEKCTGHRIGLALRTLGNISLFDVLLLVFKTAGYLRLPARIEPMKPCDDLNVDLLRYLDSNLSDQEFKYRLYSRICGYVSYGKSRCVEKSKERTFPLRLEIPESTGFRTFPTAPAAVRLGPAKNKIADLERFD
jgi:hypothetical protein